MEKEKWLLQTAQVEEDTTHDKPWLLLKRFVDVDAALAAVLSELDGIFKLKV